MFQENLTFLIGKPDETNVYIILLFIGPALQNEEENSELNSQQQLLEEQFNEEDEPLSEELNKRPKNSKSERHQFENILSALQETVENIERPALLPEDWTSMKHESSEKLENELEPEIPLDLFYKPGYLNAEHKNRMVVTEQSKGEQQLLTKSRLSPGYLKTPKMSRRKRNPRCLRSCLKRGYLHPAQCHMLC